MLFLTGNRAFRAATITLALLLTWQVSHAGPIRDRIVERRLAQLGDEVEIDESSGPAALPAGMRLMQDVPYGDDPKQRMDIYLPGQASGAPVIFMVHGGAWRLGDKGARAVVEKKIARWVTGGFIFVSVNYRMLPETDPVAEARDVASALATAQAKALSLGGDPAKFIVMGHSAGAHLVALLGASPTEAVKLGARPWLGTVLLDSAALDVVQMMEAKHPRFYDRAFGSSPAYWETASPFHVLSRDATPVLAVCSSRRGDACRQASRFVAKAISFGARASVLEQDLSHKDINQQLGVEGRYTDAVEAFMGSLDGSVRNVLTNGARTAH